MNRFSFLRPARRPAIAGALVLTAAGIWSLGLAPLGVSSLPRAGADDAPPAGAAPAPAAPAGAKPAAKPFDTKEDAAKALIEAASKNDDAALKALTGDTGDDLVQDGRDPVVAKDRAAFAAAAQKKLSYEEKDGKTYVVVGEEEWPFPIPLEAKDGKWRFDADEGRTEILARRIGRGELRAIRACREYVESQIEYASKDRDGDEVREYAQKLVSSPGKHDGLWWPAKDGEESSPLTDELAPLKGYMQVNAGAAPAPFMGYFWRVLTAQGPNAPGGAYSYVINGNMIAGFALLGVPAQYRNTGVMTIIVSNHGTVYQKDLGPQSLEIGARIETFDPDDSWDDVPAEDLSAAAK